MQGIPLSFTIYGYRVFRQGPRYYHYKPNTREVVSKIFKEMIQFHSIWAVLSDEQMSNGWPFSLLNDEQMSNKVGVEQQSDTNNMFQLGWKKHHM